MTPSRSLALALVLMLTGCATKDAGEQVGAAATTPLRDLNVVKAEIPEPLRRAKEAPYALTAAMDCAALKSEIAQLDEVLGADLDAPPDQEERGLLERGGDQAGKALQRAAEGAIPFRGWVRKLSGAERYERRVAAAITAGGVRRAFLKGVRAAKGCQPG